MTKILAGPEKTLLLVEDEVLIALSQKKSLEKYGYHVLTAASGREAIDYTRSHPINLILMDIDLGKGEMDGTEAASCILKDRDIPIVFMSSHTEREVVEKTEGISSYGYIVKSSDITVVDASIKMAFKLFRAKRREQASREAAERSEQKYRCLFENICEAIAVLDTERRIMSCNPAFTALLGYSAEELNGMTTGSIYTDDRDPAWTEIEKGHRQTSFTAHYKKKNGHIFPAETNVSVLQDENGQIIGYIKVIHDISQCQTMAQAVKNSRSYAKRYDVLRRQALTMLRSASHDGDMKNGEIQAVLHELELYQKELELQNSELRRAQREIVTLNQEHTSFYDYAPCGIVTINSNEVIMKSNYRFAAILDESVDAAGQKTFRNYVAPGCRDDYAVALREAGSTGKRQCIVSFLRNSQDVCREVQIGIIADRNAEDEVLRWHLAVMERAQEVSEANDEKTSSNAQEY